VSNIPIDKLIQEVLDKEQVERLRRLFGATDAQWPSVVDAVVAAAIAEYAEAFLGAGQTMSQASYIQQQRLRQLMQHGAFQGRLPTEEQVASIFHHNPSGARALLRNVLARFDAELATDRNATLATELGKARRSKDDVVTLYMSSPSVFEGFQNMLDTANEARAATGGPKSFPLERIARDPTVHSRWKIPFDSYQYLCEQLNVPVADPSRD